MTNVILGALGSYGDIAPSLSLARGLTARSITPWFVGPRSVLGYARQMGYRTAATGSGADITGIDDDRLRSDRFWGGCSWRVVLQDYVAPEVQRRFRGCIELFGRLDPVAVVGTQFTPELGMAAAKFELPYTSLCLYPQLLPTGSQRRRGVFARRLHDQLRLIEIESHLTSRPRPSLDWATGDSPLVLRDACLAQRGSLLGEHWVGYPAEPGEAPYQESEVVNSWLQSERRAIVTLGSFLGARSQHVLDLAMSVSRAGFGTLVLGVSDEMRARVHSGSPEIQTAAYVSLKVLGPLADVVVHHGGTGTMYACLRAARPSVVYPLALDNFANARALVDQGLGQIVEDRFEAGQLCRSAVEQSEVALEGLRSSLLPASESQDRILRALDQLIPARRT